MKVVSAVGVRARNIRWRTTQPGAQGKCKEFPVQRK